MKQHRWALFEIQGCRPEVNEDGVLSATVAPIDPIISYVACWDCDRNLSDVWLRPCEGEPQGLLESIYWDLEAIIEGGFNGTGEERETGGDSDQP